MPDRAEIGVDIRTVPSVDHAGLRRALEQHVGEKVNMEVLLDLPGVWTSPDLEWVRRVARIAAGVTGSAAPPGAATFFTDASVLTPAMGMPTTIILGPGEPGQAHQTDEWCSVAQIHAAVEIYGNVLRDWSQAGSLAERR
ncbi:MAG: M20/M25/M40 family metallo-hydrolase [Gemmatimonadaceae bacterium]